MKFNTVAEAFNFYKNHTNEQLEQRANEINHMIETDENVDIQALNVELTGIAQAKRNNDEKAQKPEKRSAFSLIGSRDDAPKSFTAETVFDSEEYRSAFFKTMLDQKLTSDEERAFEIGMKEAEKRTDAFITSGNASAVLPTQTLNEVVKKARTIGGLLGECRHFNVPTKIAIPVGTPATRASWHTEAQAVDSENVTVASVTFDGYEIMKVFSISAKARKMSINAFEAYLVDELTACVMETIADALINGTGSNQGSGLETITWSTSGANKNHVQIASSGSFTYAKIVEFVARLKRGYAQGAKIAMNNATLYTVFYGMLDGAQRPIFIADPKDESVGKILGFPVVIDDNIADNVCYLGNFSKYLGYNMPEGITIEASRESSFKKGVIDYRALAIADCKPIVSEAFVKLSKATA